MNKIKLSRFIMSWVLILTVLFPAIPVQASEFDRGSGTLQDPYQLTSAGELLLVYKYPNAHFIMMNDIDLKNVAFKMIGTYSNGNTFKGSFDGNGYTVKNLSINAPQVGQVGMFGFVQNAEIKNLNIENANITGKSGVGGIVGYMTDTVISNCSVKGTGKILGSTTIGGIVGFAANTTTDIISNINNCVNSQTVSGVASYGGIIGTSYDTNIENCINTGNIIGSTPNSNCAGGLIGSVDDKKNTKLSNSYSIGNVSGQLNIGGLIGETNIADVEYEIINCFALGKITASDYTSGGIVSYTRLSLKGSLAIKNSYFAGELAGKNRIGIQGENLVKANVSRSYFDEDVSNATTLEHAKSTAAMVKQSTFIDWDFTDVWDIDEESSYPYLRNMPKPEGVVVYPPGEVPVSSIMVSPVFVETKIGATTQLFTTIEPENATDKSLTYTSSNSAIAEVDSDGKITAKKAGTAIITVTTHNGLQKTCDVLVVEDTFPTIPVTEITVHPITLEKDSSAKLAYTVEPANATDKTLTFSSSDSGIVTVDNQGNITGKGAGSAVITLTAVNGVKAQCNVTVTDKNQGDIPVTDIMLCPSTEELNVGDTLQINAILVPTNATNKNITWRSSNPSVATVDANGNVKALSTGFTAIVALTESGNHMGFCNLYIKEGSAGNIPVENITLSDDNLSLEIGTSKQLTYNILPTNASNKQVTWSSDAPSVAAVDSNGIVTAVSAGSAVIKVETADGNHQVECRITVNPSSQPSVNLALGATASSNSVSSTKNSAAKANDSDYETRWLAKSDASNIYLELEFDQIASFNQVKISEFGKRINSYAIQIWDGANWKDVYTGNGIDTELTAEFQTVTSSKVRIMVYNTLNTYGPSIYEFEVYHK